MKLTFFYWMNEWKKTVIIYLKTEKKKWSEITLYDVQFLTSYLEK